MALRLETNVPVEIRLIATSGETAPSNFGADQIKFQTDRGPLYVSEAVGAILSNQIASQHIQANERVSLVKKETALANGRKGIRWELARVNPVAGEMPNGTYAVPVEPPSEFEQQLKASIDQVQAQKAAAALPAWTAALVQQTNALIDAYALVLKHAAKHDAVRGEDVRSIFLSTFINVSKSGGSRAA